MTVYEEPFNDGVVKGLQECGRWIGLNGGALRGDVI